jgi:hypothetical protein
VSASRCGYESWDVVGVFLDEDRAEKAKLYYSNDYASVYIEKIGIDYTPYETIN